MISKRQEQIIDIMCKDERWITGKELSKLINVSDRTIRTDIDKINKFYNDILISSSPKLGYTIKKGINNEIIKCSLKNKEEIYIPTTPKERCEYIVRKLLFQNEINLIFLQEQVFVSSYSIDNDIKRIKKMLLPYNTLKLAKNGSYISLIGAEKDKRSLYKELLADETKRNFFNMNKLASMYRDFDLIQVKKILESILEEHKFYLRETDYPMLIVHVGIAIERILMHNYMVADLVREYDKDSIECKIAKEFYNKISQRIGIKIVEDEIIQLSLLLLSKRKNISIKEYISTDDIQISLEELVGELLRYIREVFDIDFAFDKDLNIGLLLHIQSLIYRQKNNIIAANMFLQDIKRQYPLAFEMGIQVGKFLEDKLNIEINENEVGFISLHLGAAYNRLDINHKYRIIIINPYKDEFTNKIKDRIEVRFGERVKVVECFSFFEERFIKELDVDLIVTTLPLNHDLNILTVQISLFFNYEDENVIFRTLNNLDKDKFHLEFASKILKLIKQQYFYTNVELKTPEEVISFMCENLYSTGVVSKNFKNNVLKREKMSPTSFAYSFSTPHSLIPESNVSTISVTLLKEPIKWGEFEVRIVFLLAINEDDSKLLRLFFDWLTYKMGDVNKFSELLETNSYEEFIQCYLS